MGGDAERLEFEAIVIGTGFGGAVTACRLAQAGVRLCVLERGRRYQSEDFPAVPREGELLPDGRRWLWSSGQGLWDLRDLGGVSVVQAAGWGGGSLVYANVHLRPPDDEFDDHWPPDVKAGRLVSEYDLVGSMLDIRPVVKPGGQPPRNMARKVGAMREAFEATGGAARVFHPPLAIKFDPPDAAPKDNGHRRLQRGCQACGACDFGCPYGAKSTLDFNYLAEVEDRGNAQVFTLAEVDVISRYEREDTVSYGVHFRDHLTGARRTASAQTVCAGSVNTVELLLRSENQGVLFRRHGDTPAPGFDPALGPGLPDLGPGLGRRYFVNADAIGFVYDTARPIEPELGPVITTSLLQDRRPGGERTWFLVQDGGYPEGLRRLSAILESPLLLGRNRHDDRQDAQSRLAMETRPAPPRPERWSSILDGLCAALLAGDLPADRVLSEQSRGIAASVRDSLTLRFSSEVEAIAAPVAQHYLDRVADSLIERLRWCGLGFLPAFQRWLRRAVQRLAITHLDLTPGDIRAESFKVGRHRWDLDRPDRLLPTLLRWLGGEPTSLATGRKSARDPWTHRAVLLCMGRDDTAGRIVLEQGRLSIRYPLDTMAPTYSEEEQVMRAVSAGLGGRLRTSPMWAFGRQPITAHSHGGCALQAPRVTHPVTDAYGEVLTSPGLFVNDGSLLPRSIGVNPSSTIAALAERNVRHFWEQKIRKSSLKEIPWIADLNAAQGWAARQRSESVTLTPPTSAPQAVPNHFVPVGLEFEEVMSGFWTALDSPTCVPSDKQALSMSPQKLSPYLAAEVTGRSAGRLADFRLKCTVRDVEAFLSDPARTFELDGTMHLVGPKWPNSTYGVSGFLHLLPEDGRERREMTYLLETPPSVLPAHRLRLVGRKVIKAEPGLDAWIEAATLYTDVWTGSHQLKGILRLTLAEFLQVQMPSMKVTGTSDPAQITWALTRFVSFFLGSFQRVYVPEIYRLSDLLAPDPRYAPPGGRDPSRFS
jgi:choline dehydrogenase-like flavoprotein